MSSSQDTKDTTTTSNAATPAMPKARGRGSKYPPTPSQTVRDLIAYHDAAVAHLQDPEANPEPDATLLTGNLPQGSITSATLGTHPKCGTMVGVCIGERKPRWVVPAGTLLLRALPLFGGVPFIDTNKKGGQEQHYVEVAGPGFTLQRLMAGAEAGEVTRLLEDHHNLYPWSIRLEPGNPRAKRDRRTAIAQALKHYDRNAVDWGLADVLSRSDYERFLRSCFRLFDAQHGRHLLRQIRSAAVA